MLIRTGGTFFGFFHLVCRGYVYVGRVRTFFPKILQGVRFLVDGYVYTGPYSTHKWVTFTYSPHVYFEPGLC